MATIEQLIDLDITDIQRMNRRELAAVVSTWHAANKRLARLTVGRGRTVPHQQAQKRGQQFSVAGKSVNQYATNTKP